MLHIQYAGELFVVERPEVDKRRIKRRQHSVHLQVKRTQLTSAWAKQGTRHKSHCFIIVIFIIYFLGPEPSVSNQVCSDILSLQY